MLNLFQSPEWEQLKLKTGYQESFRIDDILILKKTLPFGYSMLYSPMVEESQVSSLKSQAFLNEIQLIGRKNKAIFYRLELDVPATHDLRLTTDGFIKAFEEMQPENTLILDLEKQEGEILSQMKPKGRYNIRVAEKHRVYFKKDPSEINNFYNLYVKTAQRHRITYRDKKYFEGLVDILGEKGYLSCYTGYIKEEGKEIPLSSIIVAFSGDTAIYLFGASDDQYKNLMAPYLVQWQAIKEAKASGYKKYDFFGIAPEDQPNHPWAGVTRFKRQFGGEATRILGSYDLVFKPTLYQIFKIAEKIRR